MMDENRSPDGDSYQFSNSNANRMSILNEQNLQSDKINNKNNHRPGNRATTRRIGASSFPSYNAKEYLIHKESAKSIFPGSYDNNAELNRGATVAGRTSGELIAERDHSTTIGIPRTYPIRKSHFRERNRSLLKEVNI